MKHNDVAFIQNLFLFLMTMFALGLFDNYNTLSKETQSDSYKHALWKKSLFS